MSCLLLVGCRSLFDLCWLMCGVCWLLRIFGTRCCCLLCVMDCVVVCCSSLSLLCCSLLGVGRWLLIVRVCFCLPFGVCRLPCVVFAFCVRRVRCVDCLLIVVACSLFVDCCLLGVVWCV